MKYELNVVMSSELHRNHAMESRLPTHLFLFLFLYTLVMTKAYANPAPTGISASSAFGYAPIYSPGIKPTMVVDEFGMIDSSLTSQRQQDIAKAISDWHDDGIEYGVYTNALSIETDLRFTLSEGAAINLDGTAYTSSVDDNGTQRNVYRMSLTRSAFQNYLIESGKLAIDLGADHIFMDVASIDFSTHSFDDEIVAEYQTVSGINIRDYLKTTKGYADTAALEAAIAAGDLNNDATWLAWAAYDKTIEDNFFKNWTDTLRDYATSKGQAIKLSANRYISGSDNWVTGTYFDYLLAETFIDSLGYPNNNLNFMYKTAVAFGKRFWSWNFPNNTASLNGGDNQPSNVLDRMFVAQTFANGGLSQIGGAGWVNFSKGVYPQVTIPDYQLVEAHPELFDHAEASEFAVLYSEISQDRDPGNLGAAFNGMTQLLSDAHRTWDVLFASDPNRINSVELLSLAKLQQYKAVVLPQTSYLSDSQISLLEDYLNAGGIIIGTAQVANFNEDGTDVSASRNFDNLFAVDAVDTTTYTGTVISFAGNLGQQFYNNPNDASLRATLVSQFNTAVDAIISPEITTSLPSGVHFSRYEDAADGSHIYHLVNTSYDSVNQQINAISQGESLTVPVPENFSASVNIQYVSPESTTPTTLTASSSGNSRSVNLPQINTWMILKVGSAMAAPQAIDHRPQSQAHFIDSDWSTLDDSTATGGVRPDTLDTNGDIEFAYWYWSNTSFDLPYLASDDGAISQVDLYYRYSADNTNWSNWTLAGSQTESSDVLINRFSFTQADGEGYYQFYYQATDDNGQLETSNPGSELGRGFDSTPPGLPASFSEINGVQNGVWQTSVSNPTFSWPAPLDNLSGSQSARLHMKNIVTGQEVGRCEINNQTASDNSWTLSNLEGCNNGNMGSNLAFGDYRISFQSNDNADNWNNQTDSIFSFRYGTPTVADPENISLEAGDASVTVNWTAPADLNGFNEVRVYVSPLDQNPSILNTPNSITINDPNQDNSLTVNGLNNGTEYRIAIESFNNNSRSPGNLITMDCSFTPGATPVSDCPAPSAPTDGSGNDGSVDNGDSNTGSDPNAGDPNTTDPNTGDTGSEDTTSTSESDSSGGGGGGALSAFWLVCLSWLMGLRVKRYRQL